MLNKTSELAIKTVVFLALEGGERPLSPRLIARDLECSASYLAKTTGALVRAGLLRSSRGVNGGVSLARDPGQISLLQIVEACQVLVPRNYCGEPDAGVRVCSCHEAMSQLYRRTTGTLAEWTISDLLECPVCPTLVSDRDRCRMFYRGSECHAGKVDDRLTRKERGEE
jgi:Rrf2 family protein